MRHEEPPRAATRLLEDFGPKNNQEALAGDLLESFQQGRSRAWYWRQVPAAIQWRRPFFLFLFWTAFVSYPASLDFRVGSTGWLADMAALTGLLLLSLCLPAILSGRGRACLSLLIVALALLQPYFTGNLVPEHFPWYLLLVSLIFYRNPEALLGMFYLGYLTSADFRAGSARWFLTLAAVGAYCFVLKFLRTRLAVRQKACLCVLLAACAFTPPAFETHFVFISLFISIWILLAGGGTAPVAVHPPQTASEERRPC